jgi:predicted Zn-dependent peptidase
MTSHLFGLEVEQHTLPNGLKLNLHRDPALPLVSVNLWYHVGSKNERPGRTGFAHLFEHMLFQGSQHVGTNDHFRLIQQVGGVVNGSTWYDRTNYYETLPAEHLALALWLESDRMGFLLPGLTAEKLENQRSVVMNERRQRVDNRPYGTALERLHQLLYPADHPYSWPVIGTMQDISEATLEEVQDFFRTYYTPDNAVLTLAGDFDPQEALGLVEAYFSDLSAAPQPPQRPTIPPHQPRAGQARETVYDDIRLPRVYLGFRTPAYGQPEWYAGDLLATALGTGKSSPLHEDLIYRREMAQDLSVYIYPTEASATFYLAATCRPGVDPQALEQRLWEHLDAVASNRLLEASLQRARNQVLTTFYDAFQQLQQRADLISEMTTYFGDPLRINSEANRYFQLGGDEVRSFAQRYLRPEEAVVLTFLPRPGGAA